MPWKVIGLEKELTNTLSNMGIEEVAAVHDLSALECGFLAGEFRGKYTVWTEPPLREESGSYILYVGRKVHHA